MNRNSNATKKRRKVSPLTYVFLSIFTFISIFPLYWLFVVASNSNEEIAKIPPSIVPGSRFLVQLRALYEAVPFNWALFNTIAIGIVIAVSQVFFSALAGFALAKMKFKGKKSFMIFIISTMMLPSQLGVIVLYLIMANYLNWVDDFKSLVVPALVTAFGVFWMRQIIDAQIPNELLEAASIDGASVPRIFFRIVLPIVRQSGFVLGLFAFLAAWNDYLWPTIVLQSPKHFTLQVALTQLKPMYGLDYGLQMGGAFLATAPLLILFIFVGRRLVSGVMDGAIKG
jgi:cellobiose transport system permease protein